MTKNEVQKADASLRRKTIWIVCAVFFICLIANRVLSNYLDVAEDDIALLTERVRNALYLLALAALPVLYFSFCLLRVARRVIVESRFPPTGMSVIRDTVIKTGVQARRKGYFLAAFSIILGLTVGGLPIILILVLNAFVTGA